MSIATTPTEFARRSAQAYERQLLQHVQQYGMPTLAPETAGRQAAGWTAAGEAWALDVGPFFDTDGARVALGGVSKQAVSQRVRQGRLLGLPLASDGSGPERLVYPAWQFRPSVLRHLADVLGAGGLDPDRATTGWTIATWLTTPDETLGGQAPVALLRAGHVQPVLDAAREVRASLGVDERGSDHSTAGKAAG